MTPHRRRFAAALALFAAWPSAAAASPLDRLRRLLRSRPAAGAAAPGGVRYITPHGAGDGQSWETAAAIADLPAQVRAVGPGGRILIAADRGAYALAREIVLDAGGAEGAPVRIESASEGARVELMGTRADPFDPAGETGAEGFRLIRGADHLAFRGFSFRNIGNGCFRIGGPVRDVTIADCRFRNVYRFIENTASGGEEDASLVGFVVRGCSGSIIERSFLRIRYRSSDGLVEDCRADSEGVQGDPFAVGCALEGEAHAIVYRRCVMENFRQLAGPGRYWNADGFSDEWRNANIRYEHCEARGCTDGGFDLKSDNAVLENCLAEDNKRNIRIWSPRSTLIACVSRNPNWRGRPDENGGPSHFWFGGPDPVAARLRDIVVEDDGENTVFLFEGDNVRVQVNGAAIACADEAALQHGEGALAFIPEASAPSMRKPPSIARDGETLVAQKGLWAALPRPTYAYEWRRNGRPIPGATSPRYALAPADRGASFSVAVTATNTAGAAEAVSATISVI